MLELKVAPREDFGRKTNKQRKAGQIPAVVYGHEVKSQPLYVPTKDFLKVYKEAGESTLVALNFGGKKHNVLIHDVLKDPVSDAFLHVDFYQVNMDEKIKAKVPLVFVGESTAVKAEGGVLIKNIQEIEVEALPQNLPHHIDVDIASLATFEDRILIKDLSVGSGVQIEAEPDEIVASVTPPRSEEELASLEQKAEEKIEEVKVVGEEEKKAEEAAASETDKETK